MSRADKPLAYAVYDIESNNGNTVLTGACLAVGAKLVLPERLRFVVDAKGDPELDPSSVVEDSILVWLKDPEPEDKASSGDPDTIRWLETPGQGALVREEQAKHAVPRQEGVDTLAARFIQWDAKWKLRWVAGPASFDHFWLKKLLEKYGYANVSKDIIRHKTTCLSTLRDALMAKLRAKFTHRFSDKASELGPKALDQSISVATNALLNPTGLRHTHNPEDDAMEAAIQFCIMQNASDIKIGGPATEFLMDYIALGVRIVYHLTTGKITTHHASFPQYK